MRSNEEPGGAMSSQEEPGGAMRSHKYFLVSLSACACVALCFFVRQQARCSNFAQSVDIFLARKPYQAMLVADLESMGGSWLASQSVFRWPIHLLGPPALKLDS
jgi:hypothetical protein